MRGERHHPGVLVAGCVLERELQAIGREQWTEDVAPLDDHDRIAADQFVEAEVMDLLQVLEAVHVDVHDR